MAETHSLGYPDEYFNDVVMRVRRPETQPSPEAKLECAIADGTSFNGVLSMKVHAGHMQNDGAGILLRSPLPCVSWVTMERNDRLGQAISLEIALQTGAWNSTYTVDRKKPTYDAAAITARIAELEAGARFWDSFFPEHGIEPLRLIYEDVAADTAGAIRMIAEFTGTWLFPSPVRLLCSRFNPEHLANVKKQRTALNDQWRAQWLLSRDHSYVHKAMR
jgi:LPS sulfotransferase NodH